MFKITLITFVICFVIERLFVGWRLPKVHSWYTRVVLINIVQLGVILLAGLTWEKWFSSYSVFHFSEHMNIWSAGLVAYFIATFIFYWSKDECRKSDALGFGVVHQTGRSRGRL